MSFSDIAARMRQTADENNQNADAPRDFKELYLLRARILGVLIRDARQAAGLSPDEVAKQIGVNATTVESWELGKTMPSLPELELLAFTLNVPISHFWGTETLRQQAAERTIDPTEYAAVRRRLIGALLRAARQQKNLTVEQVAAEAGVEPAYITAYELGQRPIPVPILTSLAQACGLNLSYFLENGNRIGSFLLLQEDMQAFAALPPEMRHFVATPVNQAYIELAMRLARMSTGELRGLAEAILNITL